jgi:uncharacterized protein
VAALCERHAVAVALGLDGPPESNDAFRIYQDGSGTYADISRALDLLRERNVVTYASVSITPRNVNDLPSCVSFLTDLGIEQIGFNFLRGKQALNLVPEGDLLPYYRMASRNLIELFRNSNRPHYEYQMGKKWLALLECDPFPVDCTCYGSQLVIQPDGEISNCPFSKPKIGHVRSIPDTFRIAQTDIVKKWRSRLPLYHEAYRDCDAKALCGGGCLCGVDEIAGSSVVDEGMKLFAEEALNELIWINLKNSKRF